MTSPTLIQVVEPFQHRTKIKASKFIADIFPVRSEEEALERITEVKRREHAANHHCFAWRIGFGDDEMWRVSDDGEPSGTAGMPIYQVLLGVQITNVLAVVTRYFGGTKLGKGGLIRAYGGIIQEAIPLMSTKPFIPSTSLTCKCDFEHANLVYRLLENYDARIIDQDYGSEVKIRLRIRADQADKFAWELHDLSNGIIKAKTT